MMKTRTLKYMMTAVLLLAATVCMAGTPRKVKVNSIVKSSTGMKKSASQQRAISSASALVGTFTASGSNLYDIASWPVTVTLDNSNSNKVWLANLSPRFYQGNYQAPTYNYFYGTLNSGKTELHIPVEQRMTGTYSFTGNNTQYTNQIVYIGAYDEYNCSEGYINVHDDDIVFRIENNGSRLVVTDSIFLYSIGSDNTFWMLDEIYKGTVLTKEGGNGIYLSTAGTLDTKVSGSETSLTISGYLNGADLKVLRDMAVDKNLKELDIQGCTILGGNSTKYYSDYTASENKTLPPYLFYNSKLESIVLPSNLTKLDDYCLARTKLTTITIPASVTTVSSSCFYGCSAMTAINVESGSSSFVSYDSGVLYTKNGATLVKYPEGKTGTSYIVRGGVTTISSFAFQNTKLTSISLPTSLTTLGSSVFSNSAVTSLSIPAALNSVSTSSFSNMKALRQFTVASGNSILSTDSYALFNKNKTLLKAYALGNTMTAYTVPSTVTEIEYDAFWNDQYLKTITLPENLTTIGGYAFSGCSKLEEINIPSKVTSIGSYAFSSNSNMKKVTSYITSPTDLSEYVFNSTCDVATLYVPSGKKSTYQARTGWNKFKTITEMGSGSGSVTYSNGTMTVTVTTAGTLQSTISNSSYASASVTKLIVNGPLNGADLKVLREMTTTGTVTNLDIKNTTIVGGDPTAYYGTYKATDDNVLPQYLFSRSKLLYITVPKTITTIEKECFANSASLKELSIPASVTSIEGSFVNGCTSLTIFYVEGGNTYMAYNGVLYSKDGYTLVRYPEGSTATSFTVRSAVTTIGDYAFYNTKPTTVNLPSQLKKIGGCAFYSAKVTSISLPTTLTTLDHNVFAYSAITSLSIPASLTSVTTTSFSAMYSLTQFSVATGNTALSTDNRALFDKNKTLLKAYAHGNTSTTYTIPSTVTEIEYDAFWGNEKLKTITLPANVKKIGGWAFASCSSLEEINIPAQVTSIGSYAFSGNSNMKKVTSDITAPFDVDEAVFNKTCEVATLYVPAGKKSAYQARTGWNMFTNIVEQGGTSGSVTFNNGTMTLTMSSAGTLQTTIANSGYLASNVKELVITGPINGTDIRYIRQLAGINYSNTAVTATLESLNLDNANIVSGGDYYKSSAYATSNNVVGSSMFADTKLKFISLPKTATTIMSQAFGNCKQLIGVTVHDKVTSIPSNLFNDCSALCYIDWKPTRSLTSGMLPTSSTRNPNLLLYVTSSSYAPYTTPNVVVGSTASQVTLTSGNGFWAPREFTATNISYTRSFTKTTGNGSARGWETITLPFQPTKISHATKGELVPFGRWSGVSDTKKPFWLYGFGSSGFTASNYLYANQPYIIAMPNNTSYDDAYRVNGTVTFSATSATVKVSSLAVGTTNGVRTLRPTYQAVESANNKYVLNATGSQFTTYRAASPFEAYFTTTESNARGVIDIFDEQPTGLDAIPTADTEAETIYDLQGRKVETPQRGLYIKNGRKVIVR